MNLIWIKRRRRRQQQHDWLRLISSSAAATTTLFFSSSSLTSLSPSSAIPLSLSFLTILGNKSTDCEIFIAGASRDVDESIHTCSKFVSSSISGCSSLSRNGTDSSCFSRKGGRPWFSYVCQMWFVEINWGEQGIGQNSLSTVWNKPDTTILLHRCVFPY